MSVSLSRIDCSILFPRLGLDHRMETIPIGSIFVAALQSCSLVEFAIPVCHMSSFADAPHTEYLSPHLLIDWRTTLLT